MMKAKLRALCAQYDMLPEGAHVLCAVSGGADSMCLLHLLRAVAEEWGFTLQAAHFNHKLRGEESQRDENFVRTQCNAWKISLLCECADVRAEAAKSGRGVEETARYLRYEFLERAAVQCGATHIATAHTANDNAETMLFHLARGTALQGLTGIPPRRGNVVRPLLTCTRAEVEEYCVRNGVSHVEDTTNHDQTYTRNYLRYTVLPQLERVNPRTVEHMSDAARYLRLDQDYLETQARLIADQGQETENGFVISTCLIREAHPAIAGRVVRNLMNRVGIQSNGTSAHVEAILKLCCSEDPSGRCDLPGVKVHRMYDKLVFSVEGDQSGKAQAVLLQRNGTTEYGMTGWSVSCRKGLCPQETGKNPAHFYLACDKIQGTMLLRPRQIGDEIKLPGRPGKSLKKLMIDEKIPLNYRDRIPVLADEQGVIALAGIGPDEARLACPGEEAFEITFTKERK